MKEKKSISGLIWIIIILILLLIVAMTYIAYDKVLSDKKTTTTTTTTTDVINNQEDNKESKTLTDEELNKYISYVPINPNGDDVYSTKYTDVETVKSKLLYMVLGYAYDNLDEYFQIVQNDGTFNPRMSVEPPETYYFMEKSKLDSIAKKMYNLNSSDFELKESKTNYIANYNGRGFFYFNSGFSFCEDGEGSAAFNVNLIDNYEIKNNELVITEYITEQLFGELKDLYTGQTIYNKNTADTFDEMSIEETKAYLKNNKEKFTQYKHTFKLNENNDYYWYSTEVVE